MPVVQQSPVSDTNTQKTGFSSFNESESNILSTNSNFDTEKINENQISKPISIIQNQLI